jgi:hypothetical protein
MKNTATIKKHTQGKLSINAAIVNNIYSITIQPASNGHYAITFRTILDKKPELFRYELQGKLHVSYSHPHLPTLHYEAVLADIGVEDQDSETIVSFFLLALPKEEQKLIKL